MSDADEPVEDDGELSEDARISDDPEASDDAEIPDDAEVPSDAEIFEDVPDWDDEYLDRVSDRLMYSFDLENGYRVRGEQFDMYGEVRVENRKQLLHPALNYANHEAHEHLFARRADRVTIADLERLVELGHDLADEWIVADEEHFETEFTFVLAVPELPEDVREFVEGFSDRTLLKFGFFGRYEVNLVVVAPDEERLAASRNADAATAFSLWEDVARPDPGLVQRFVRAIWQ